MNVGSPLYYCMHSSSMYLSNLVNVDSIYKTPFFFITFCCYIFQFTQPFAYVVLIG
ncbi:hypothetical protein BDF19DRAFT_437553, partial [Syncephalis fuscata]